MGGWQDVPGPSPGRSKALPERPRALPGLTKPSQGSQGAPRALPEPAQGAMPLPPRASHRRRPKSSQGAPKAPAQRPPKPSQASDAVKSTSRRKHDR
eukprot:5774631-Pyramimonas_sp.AAC.1